LQEEVASLTADLRQAETLKNHEIANLTERLNQQNVEVMEVLKVREKEL